MQIRKLNCHKAPMTKIFSSKTLAFLGKLGYITKGDHKTTITKCF